MGSPAVSVAVFIDWQNTYKTAREAFGLRNMPNEYGNYSPYRLARRLAMSNGRGAAGQLVRVNVHRGLPSLKWDPDGYAANRRQSAAWMQENPEIVIPRMRPLRYPADRTEPPREKGVDVELAISAVEWVLGRQCDVAIVFSHDSDLVPVVEAICRLASAGCVETAAWNAPGFNQRIKTKERVHHHALPREVFDGVATPINYAHRSN